jgi:glycosyltransferase involved in cell wall biosynthesis
MVYKYFVSVCLCIKNEAKYIEEFIQHYIDQGVDHFYIVNNNSDDNIEEVLDKSNYKLNVTLITDNRDMKILKSDEGQYGHKQLIVDNLYDIIKEETEWAILVDADEFMYGKNGHTIKSYLSSIDENIGCIYVIWNIINPYKDENNNLISEFSIKNNVKRINHDLMSKLPDNIKFANDFGKSIFKTNLLIHPNNFWIHLVKIFHGKTINNYNIERHDIFKNHFDNGNCIPYSEENFNNVNITLNHYAIRNLEDFEKKKRQLDCVHHKFTFITGLLDMLNLDDSFFVTDDSLVNRN